MEREADPLNISTSFESDFSVDYPELIDVERMLKQYVIPCDLFLGILGNMFTGISFFLARDKTQKFLRFLSATAFVDVGYLMSLLVTWLDQKAFDVYAIPGLCQMSVFCSHYFAFLSFWYLAWVLILWTMSSLAPRAYKNFRLSGQAKFYLVGISIFAFTGHLCKTWTYGVIEFSGKRFCTLLPENEAAMEVLKVFDTIFMQLFPFAAVVVFYGQVIRTRPPCRGRLVGRSRENTEEFRILVVTTVMFQLLVLPTAVTQIAIATSNPAAGRQLLVLLVANLLQHLFYAYFALKPVVYFVVSSTCRDQLRRFATLTSRQSGQRTTKIEETSL